MIAIFDPGIGNLQSVQTALARAGEDVVVIDRATTWQSLQQDGTVIRGVVLPGVGAFGDAMFQLRASGLIPVIRQVAREGLPMLGICLGMQLLFASSEEHGNHVGLGLLPGTVVRFQNDVKIPHMGWNDLDQVETTHPLLAGVQVGDFVYFVHSYYVQAHAAQDVLASALYGKNRVPAVVGHGTVLGTQFHPEKSGRVGERILHNFVSLCQSSLVSREGQTI